MKPTTKKRLIVLGSVLGGLLFVPLITLAYFGFVPGLSNLFGSNQARDLGVEYTTDDYQSYLIKAKAEITPLDAPTADGRTIVYRGESELDTAFTQEEITALLRETDWRTLPIHASEVRINPDGTAELSGSIRMDVVEDFAQELGYNDEQIGQAKSALNLVLTDPPVYIKAKPTVTNNQVEMNLEKLEIGRFSVPLGSYDAEAGLTDLAETIIQDIPKAQVQSANFTGGKLNFEGTLPSEVQVLR